MRISKEEFARLSALGQTIQDEAAVAAKKIQQEWPGMGVSVYVSTDTTDIAGAGFTPSGEKHGTNYVAAYGADWEEHDSQVVILRELAKELIP